MAVLLAEEADFRSKQKSGSQEIQIVCDCPECGTTYVIEGKDLPAEVRDRILNRRTPRSEFTLPISPDVRFR